MSKVSNEALNWYADRRRAVLYALLSAIFKDHLTVNATQQITGHTEFADVGSLFTDFMLKPDEGIVKATEEITNFLTHLDKERELELQKEFARLFLQRANVHPYESVYLGNKKLLMDTPWEKVRKFYQIVGVMRNQKEMLLEDHIAVELGFIASLAYMSSDATGRSFKNLVKIQQEFVQKHLVEWIPALVAAIEEKTEVGSFYHNAANVVKSLVLLDLYYSEEGAALPTCKVVNV